MQVSVGGRVGVVSWYGKQVLAARLVGRASLEQAGFTPGFLREKLSEHVVASHKIHSRQGNPWG